MQQNASHLPHCRIFLFYLWKDCCSSMIRIVFEKSLPLHLAHGFFQKKPISYSDGCRWYPGVANSLDKCGIMKKTQA